MINGLIALTKMKKFSDIKFPSQREVKPRENYEIYQISDIAEKPLEIQIIDSEKDSLGEFFAVYGLLNNKIKFCCPVNHQVLYKKIQYLIKENLLPISGKVILKNGRYYDFE